jgi:hypothetical protein
MAALWLFLLMGSFVFGALVISPLLNAAGGRNAAQASSSPQNRNESTPISRPKNVPPHEIKAPVHSEPKVPEPGLKLTPDEQPSEPVQSPGSLETETGRSVSTPEDPVTGDPSEEAKPKRRRARSAEDETTAGPSEEASTKRDRRKSSLRQDPEETPADAVPPRSGSKDPAADAPAPKRAQRRPTKESRPQGRVQRGESVDP